MPERLLSLFPKKISFFLFRFWFRLSQFLANVHAPLQTLNAQDKSSDRLSKKICTSMWLHRCYVSDKFNHAAR